MKVTNKFPDKHINRLIIDLSSVGRAAHYLGRDEEGYQVVDTNPKTGKERKTWVNSSEHALENWLRTYLHVLELTDTTPFSTIIVKDGKDSRVPRKKILPTYKDGRVSPPQEINDEFNEFCDKVCDMILSLGGTVSYQDGMEADDVIAYFAKNLDGHKTIWSTDGDMLALHNDNVDVYYQAQINPPLPGCPVTEWIPIYKALVGDKSDNLKGAKGFGDATFLKLVTAFGDEGMTIIKDLLENGQLKRLKEDVADFKPLQIILDHEDMVYACYECAKFMDHRINTLKKPLNIQTGYVHQWDKEKHHPDLEQWYGSSYLINADNFDEFYGSVCEALKESPFVALDIEGSTPEESDAWCKAIKESGKGKKKDPFDSFGFGMDGMSLTFGDNLQNTIYMTVGHLVEDGCPENCTADQVKSVVKQIPSNIRTIVHNSSFELPTVFRVWGDSELDNGFRGYLPNVWCTVLMHQYVNENIKSGLKGLSKLYFNYDQVKFEDLVKDPETGRMRKMNELTAKYVTDYACDDPIMTAALANRCQIVMEIEHTLDVFEEVEFFPQYVCGDSFNKGVPVDLKRLAEIEAEDEITFEKNWKVAKEYLVAKKWPGTFFDMPEKFAAAVKYCFAICFDEPLKTRFAIPKKLAAACREAGATDRFCTAVEVNDLELLGSMARADFTFEPDFKVSSPKQMKEILYGVTDEDDNVIEGSEYLGLPIRLRNKPTQNMRDAGIWEGAAKADADSIKHALKYDIEEDSYNYHLLKAFQKMTECDTRKKLFYTPYKLLVHWKDGKFHPNLGQTRTRTRRFAPSSPNVNQMSKRGEGKKLREVIIPYSKTQKLVALDYDGQELVLTADTSKDPAMMSCYSGEVRRDVHSMTGSKIAVLQKVEEFDTYDKFLAGVKAKDPEAKKLRDTAKPVNFGYVYDITAGGLAVDLIVPEAEAKLFLSAYDEAFPGVPKWKKTVVARLKKTGKSFTRMGAVRHLQDAILSVNSWERKKAERQAVNYEIQGSAGEQTKLGMSRMWLNEYLYDGNSQFYFPVHDEVLQSVDSPREEEITEKIRQDLTVKYADMELTMTAGSSSGPNFGQLN